MVIQTLRLADMEQYLSPKKIGYRSFQEQGDFDDYEQRLPVQLLFLFSSRAHGQRFQG